MNVNSVKMSNQCAYKKPQISFKCLRREVCTNMLINRNDTCFFRDGDLIKRLVDYLVKKFECVSKVNLYSYGCSIGEEAYSFLMYLVSKFPNDVVEKFTPIIAKDKDSFIIEEASANKPHIICTEEYENILKFTNNKYDRFLKENQGQVTIKDIIRNKVKFDVADITNDYVNINPDNSVVLMRNFLPYLNGNIDRWTLIRNLGKHLNSNSYLMIGEFDVRGTEWKVTNEIIDSGFERTEIEYLFKKKD